MKTRFRQIHVWYVLKASKLYGLSYCDKAAVMINETTNVHKKKNIAAALSMMKLLIVVHGVPIICFI